MNDTNAAHAALLGLVSSRRLLSHAKSCPSLFDGDCSCGAQHAADLIGEALAALARMEARAQQLEEERDRAVLELDKAIDEATNGKTASAPFIDQCVERARTVLGGNSTEGAGQQEQA